MQLYFIRHGQSTNNVVYAETGSHVGRVPEPELTELGSRQAEAVANYFAQRPTTVPIEERYLDWGNLLGVGITHLYTSLMVRAVETAQAIASATSVKAVACRELYETGGVTSFCAEKNAWEGLPGNTREYYENRFPELLLPEDWHSEGWYNKPFEEAHLRAERAARVIARLVDEHSDNKDVVACVTHAGFHDHLVKVILRLRHEGPLLFPLNNCAITRIDWCNGQPCLVFLNRICHLAEEEVT